MITTDTVKLDRTGLATVPPGTGKKAYSIGCYQKSDWEFIHTELKKDGSLEDNIPSGSITVTDEKLHSDTRGTYMLTDAEAEDLKKHEKVKFVNIDYNAYPGTYQPDPGKIITGVTRNIPRFQKSVSNYRAWNTAPSTPPTSQAGIGVSDKNRTGYQILRHLQKENPWDATVNGLSGYDHHIFEQDIYQLGDGTGVDAVVCDDGFWLGHPEFVSTPDDPPLWKTGNALTWSGISTTAGTCGVLDVLLDGPYYIDPDYFNADPGSRLIQRWDGTTVPTDAAAMEWWTDSSKRSVGFSTIGVVNGINASYSRSVCLGDNNSKPSNGTNHGTQCSGQVFGKNYGSAYNANRWVLNGIGNNNAGINGGIFDIQKLFHLYKPNYDWRSEGQIGRQNSDKNPTLSSNSWGYRSNSFTNGSHYWYRPAAIDGSVTGIAYTSGFYAGPRFFRVLGGYGDSGRCKGEMVDSSVSTAGEEMHQAGVIFVCAAGNSNQTQCAPDSPEYNNYWADSDNTALVDATHLEFGLTMYNTLNRRGWPQHLGKSTSGLSTSGTTFPAINIGALDDQISATGYGGNVTEFKERIVNYSDKGSGIDCYGAADDTLTADGEDVAQTYPHPETYSGLSITPYDKDFGGTSSACPTCAGWLTTKLQYNRGWDCWDLKNWLKNQCGVQDPAKFYDNGAVEGADNYQWEDVFSLQGGTSVVIWDAPTGSPDEPQRPQLRLSNAKGLKMSGFTVKFT